MITNRNVTAWLVMTSVIGLHVLDETLTDFLPFYNQMVLDLRAKIGFFPAPNFSFGVWLGGLIGGILLCYCITPLVARGGKVIRIITTVLGILMVANGLSHLLGSIYTGTITPGTRSSLLLLGAAVFVVFQGIKGVWDTNQPLAENDT